MSTSLLARPAVPTSVAASVAHARRAHDVIPGGAHTYAKGDDQFPEDLAPIIARGQGCCVWDLDGNKYLEFGSGLRSVTLGHGCRPICDAAFRATLGGTNFARPAAIELRAAEALLALVPGAEMCKFAKHGSDATTAAVKLARAATGRTKVAVCADHPFFSVDDWFICTTECDAGIPASTRADTVGFRYNDLASLEKVLDEGDVACVILEAEKDEAPRDGFLHKVRELCTRRGALMVVDEIINGFRLSAGGGAALHGVVPDLTCWGKALANGFAVSALLGRREVMELGGIRQTDADRAFLLSTTHGGDTGGLAACLATIEQYRQRDVCANLAATGARLRDALATVARDAGVAAFWQVTGHPANLVFVTKDAAGQRSQKMRTLFLQELLKRGVLAPSLVVSEPMGEREIDHAAWAVGEALGVYRAALEDGPERFLQGRPVKPVFRRRA